LFWGFADATPRDVSAWHDDAAQRAGGVHPIIRERTRHEAARRSTRTLDLTVKEETLSKINRWSVRVAFVAIALGLVAALMLIWGPDSKEFTRASWQLFGTACALFAAASAALCTIKYFYLNRDSQKP